MGEWARNLVHHQTNKKYIHFINQFVEREVIFWPKKFMY